MKAAEALSQLQTALDVPRGKITIITRGYVPESAQQQQRGPPEEVEPPHPNGAKQQRQQQQQPAQQHGLSHVYARDDDAVRSDAQKDTVVQKQGAISFPASSETTVTIVEQRVGGDEEEKKKQRDSKKKKKDKSPEERSNGRQKKQDGCVDGRARGKHDVGAQKQPNDDDYESSDDTSSVITISSGKAPDRAGNLKSKAGADDQDAPRDEDGDKMGATAATVKDTGKEVAAPEPSPTLGNYTFQDYIDAFMSNDTRHAFPNITDEQVTAVKLYKQQYLVNVNKADGEHALTPFLWNIVSTKMKDIFGDELFDAISQFSDPLRTMHVALGEKVTETGPVRSDSFIADSFARAMYRYAHGVMMHRLTAVDGAAEDSLTGELKRARMDHASAEENARKKQRENEQLKEQAKQAQESEQKRQRENEELKEQAKQAQESEQQVKRENEALKEQKKQAEESNRAKAQEFEDMKRELASMKKENQLMKEAMTAIAVATEPFGPLSFSEGRTEETRMDQVRDE